MDSPFPSPAGCPGCGARNPAGQRFCDQCGAALHPACPACGRPVGPAARFCGDCGAALPGTAPQAAATATPPAPSSPAGGPRVVSVLFADLVGFTPLTESQDPESVRELLSGYFDVARTVITRAGGVVEKFIGDAVMAVWGAETAREDDAERAVRAGLELVAQVAAYGEARPGPGLTTRVGVVTGSVATWARDGEGLVAGDRVNLASRVQASAEPGTVYVDGATREASHAGLAYEPAGTHALKGIAEPVALWRAERVLARVGGGGRGGEWEAPFVGRRHELAWCKELFHDVAERSRARLLSVTGLAGVGKSRITWELEKYLDGLQGTVFWHRGRCLAYGEGVAFWPLAEMVRGRLHLAEDLPASDLPAALEAGLATLGLPAAEVPALREALAVLLGLPGPAVERAELFARWRRLFELLAAQAPVVLIVDDGQWADAGLLDFLESLLDWAAESPLLVMTLSRPEIGQRRPGWGTGRRNAAALALEPLTAAEMTELLRGLVPDLPAPTAARIVAAAEGIPLYAVELVRALAEQGTLERRGERYAVVGAPGELPVPASLTALLAARLDTLSPTARALASRLAVFAGALPPAAAAAVAELSARDLELGLAELRRAEVLSVRADPLASDRGQYVFTQGLLRQAAYDRLSRAERRAAHLAAASHLQQALPDAGAEVAEAIAVHLEAAHAATPPGPESAGLRTEAALAFARAGARAAAVGAPAEALRAYRRALALSLEDPAAADWRIAGAEGALAAADYEAALALTAESDAGATPGDPRAVPRAILRSRALLGAGRVGEQGSVLGAALAARAGIPPDADTARLHAWLARAHFFAGNPEAAEAAADRALDEGQAFRDLEALRLGADLRSAMLARRGRSEEGLVLMEWSLRLASQSGIAEQMASATNLADLEAQWDRPEAEAHAESAVAFARRAGHRSGLALSASNLVWIWSLRGRWDDAERLATALLDDERSPLHPVDRGHLHWRLAILAGWRGDRQAATLHTAALEVMAASEHAQTRAVGGAALVAVALGTGEPAAALAAAEPILAAATDAFGLSHDAVRQLWPDSVEAAISCGAEATADRLLAELSARPPGLVPPYLLTQLARLRGLRAARAGDPQAAARDFAAAEEGFRRLAYPYWLARAQLDRATALAALEDAGAAPLAGAAAETFTRLAAPIWADRACRLAPAPEAVAAASG